MLPVWALSLIKPCCISGALENGDSAHLNEVERRQRELQSKQQQLLREQRSADQEKLLACITGGLPASPVLRESNLECSARGSCKSASSSQLNLLPETPTS